MGAAPSRRAEQTRGQVQAAGDAIGAGVRAGADIVRRGAATVGRQAQAAGRAQTDAALVQQKQARAAAVAVAGHLPGPAALPSQVLRRGTPSDPGPWRLYEEYATGKGPDARVLGPDSSFSREFVQAPSVQDYIQESLGNWRRQNGGVDMYANPRRRDFGVTEFLEDGAAGNGASHVIGTFGMAGERRDDRIDWWAENDMSRHSELGGRYLDKAGLPSWPSLSRPGPRGTTHQTILFSTDLEGRPLTGSR